VRIPSSGGRRRARIEIIPLIDVIFFLLATFMMVSLSMIKNRGIPVHLPAASSGGAQDRGGSASITVTATEEIYYDKERVDFEGLTAHLKRLAEVEHDPKVFLHGDEGAKFGLVIGVLDRVREEGITKVSIETRAKPQEGRH
jgi:biopolymer transport protein ExbD